MKDKLKSAETGKSLSACSPFILNLPSPTFSTPSREFQSTESISTERPEFENLMLSRRRESSLRDISAVSFLLSFTLS